MRSFFVLAVTAALIAIAVAAPTLPRVAYDNHKVIRIIPSTVEQARAIRGLGRFSALGLDFWQEPSFVGQPIDVRVPPQSLAAFEGYLREINAEFSTIINDVQELIEATMPGPLQADADFFSTYHTLDDINAWLKQQVAQYPNLASLVNVGTTHEGRTLTAIKITGKGTGPKPGFWFDGGIHAREWISTGVNVYLIGTLLSKYGTDANITRIVDAIEFTILPVFNADGYVYTFATDRMWRKTRSPNAGSSCVGVDPNRNWDEHWGEAGASTDPCAEDYQGPSAFSEIEVKSVAQYIKAQGNIKGYINFHSTHSPLPLPRAAIRSCGCPLGATPRTSPRTMLSRTSSRRLPPTPSRPSTAPRSSSVPSRPPSTPRAAAALTGRMPRSVPSFRTVLSSATRASRASSSRPTRSSRAARRSFPPSSSWPTTSSTTLKLVFLTAEQAFTGLCVSSPRRSVQGNWGAVLLRVACACACACALRMLKL
eukprot:Opistho-1_new@5360